MAQMYDLYQQLVARVEAFGQGVHQRYPEHVACHAGCDGCCYQQFTVFPVEAYHLAQAAARLIPEARQRLRQHLRRQDDPWRTTEQPQPCVLLDQGRCLLYEARPLICRMHGYPITSAMIERDDGGQRDCCPLNFTDVPLHEIDSQAVYNLDLVNQTLTAINHRFVREHQLPDRRVTIKQAVLQALESCLAQEEDRGETHEEHSHEI